MNALLVRVGVDQSIGGGRWNGPADRVSREFVYVSIPEEHQVHPGMSRPYSILNPFLARFGVSLPAYLLPKSMHLDPDFEYLTYGDQGERAAQLREHLESGDLIVFYASFQDIRDRRPLVYALIGLLVVEDLIPAWETPLHDRDRNAHSRRILSNGSNDVIVRGRPGCSGRLQRLLPIGEYRNRAYRVRPDVLDAWGELTVKDGYLQRSARLPRFVDPGRLMSWLERQNLELVQAIN